MRENQRREFLKGTASSLAVVAGFGGVTAADSNEDESFESVLNDWTQEHGKLVDAEFEQKDGPQTREITYIFKDGHSEEVFETVKNNKLIHKVDGEKYKKSLKEVRKDAKKIKKNRDPKEPSKTTEDASSESQSLITTQAVPTVDPGNDKNWNSANGGSTNTDEELAIDDTVAKYSESNFKAEASSTAVAAGAASAESIVYREWQVGYESDQSNPTMKVTVDYDFSGHLSGFASDAALKGRLWLEDTLTGDYVENYVINKTAMPADNYNNQKTGTQEFTMEARPGRKYRLAAQGYTKVVAVATSGGQSFFNDTMLMNNWVEIDSVDLEWI